MSITKLLSAACVLAGVIVLGYLGVQMTNSLFTVTGYHLALDGNWALGITAIGIILLLAGWVFALMD